MLTADRSVGRSVCRSVDWLAGLFNIMQIIIHADRLAGWQVVWLVSLDSQTDRQQHKASRQAREEYRRACRQAGRAKSQKIRQKKPKYRPPTQISKRFPRANFCVEWGYYPKNTYI